MSIVALSPVLIPVAADCLSNWIQGGVESYMTYGASSTTRTHLQRTRYSLGRCPPSLDDMRILDRCVKHPEPTEAISKDVSEPVDKLPLICVEPAKRFCQEGRVPMRDRESRRVPGHPLSQ
ncbi:hypothetical protein GGR56DRAFT_457378 [Xylariaceae sp. FL0804]|nr:hypothetical protein GGR56DRAFT_457378 [Xylariaceae sp. FL0804]